MHVISADKALAGVLRTGSSGREGRLCRHIVLTKPHRKAEPAGQCLTCASRELLQAPVAARSTSRALYAAPSASPENMRRCGMPCKHPGQLHLPAGLWFRIAPNRA